jgi:anti-sigma factor RsiW
MNDVRKEELIRIGMQRELTPEEESRLEAWLAAHPEARAQWEEERALSRALRSLPDVAVSSNFTARVWQAVDLEEAQEDRRARGKSWRHLLLPRWRWGVAAALLVSLGLFELRTVKQAQFNKQLRIVSRDVARLPSPEVLEDFDAIARLQEVSVTSDDELLAAFK